MPSTRQGNREGDNPELTPYGQAMERGHPYIRLKLEVPDAIELGAFVGAFTAIASEYDRFVRAENNNRPSDATLYVSEVRKGSIIADLLPDAGMFSDLAVFAGQAVDLEEFLAWLLADACQPPFPAAACLVAQAFAMNGLILRVPDMAPPPVALETYEADDVVVPFRRAI